ncbi:MAG: molybdate ABC transporter permease subunit [Candidatus Glassbacteria bacterium]|nr:molybdate ABC transporter permease subunit [Candidatus Glassbacteria bacterium]
MYGAELSAIWLSIYMGILAVVLCIAPGVALAWLLARRDFHGKSIVEMVVFLPLVIPPVVTGFFLIKAFSPQSLIGGILNQFGIRVLFTWTGMAIAAGVMGFPLLVRTVRNALENVDPRLESAARTLGCSPLRTFFTVTLPLSWPGIVAGGVLCFARALGEFGATAMVSAGTQGNRTIPLEIFHHHQTPGHEAEVIRLVIISLALSALALMASEALIARAGTKRFNSGQGS